MLSRLVRSPATAISGGFLVFLLIVAVLAPVLAPHDPFAQDLTKRFLPHIPQVSR